VESYIGSIQAHLPGADRRIVFDRFHIARRVNERSTVTAEVVMKVATRFSVIAGVLAAVICSSAPGAAAQGQPIVGCVKPGTGLLRIPPPGEGCKANETPLGFNDLPLLVALRELVLQLQEEVQMLQDRLTAVEACTDVVPECNPE
jgi:hypothetical protein